jgi:hypothetical protein
MFAFGEMCGKMASLPRQTQRTGLETKQIVINIGIQKDGKAQGCTRFQEKPSHRLQSDDQGW